MPRLHCGAVSTYYSKDNLSSKTSQNKHTQNFSAPTSSTHPTPPSPPSSCFETERQPCPGFAPFFARYFGRTSDGRSISIGSSMDVMMTVSCHQLCSMNPQPCDRSRLQKQVTELLRYPISSHRRPTSSHDLSLWVRFNQHFKNAFSPLSPRVQRHRRCPLSSTLQSKGFARQEVHTPSSILLLYCTAGSLLVRASA